MSYERKYLKYKSKYLNLKKLLGGNPECNSMSIKTTISTGSGLADIIKTGCKIGDFVQDTDGKNEHNKKLVSTILDVIDADNDVTVLHFMKAYSANDYDIFSKYLDKTPFLIRQKKKFSEILI